MRGNNNKTEFRKRDCIHIILGLVGCLVVIEMGYHLKNFRKEKDSQRSICILTSLAAQ